MPPPFPRKKYIFVARWWCGHLPVLFECPAGLSTHKTNIHLVGGGHLPCTQPATQTEVEGGRPPPTQTIRPCNHKKKCKPWPPTMHSTIHSCKIGRRPSHHPPTTTQIRLGVAIHDFHCCCLFVLKYYP